MAANWYDKYKTEKILIQQEENHNKFWAARYDETSGTVYVRWGRIGTAGQTQKKSFGNVYAATDFITTKFREKNRKGYTNQYQDAPITQEVLDKLATEAAIVGTQNKCSQLTWVEVQPGGYKVVSAERLSDPECNPGLLAHLTTRKEYAGNNEFIILFTEDAAWLATSTGHCTSRITKTHVLYELVQRVEEAVGRSLS